VNRPFLDYATSLLSILGGDSATRQRGSKAKRARRLGFEMCESRNLLAGASITGIKVETVNNNGFSPGDTPLAGVFIDLYKDNGDAVFNVATDALADRQQTAAGTGAYAFNNVADGRYFIQEEVPAGYVQSAGPAFYTLDVINGAAFTTVTTNIDDFSDPSPADVFFINAVDPNPLLLQESGPGIIGGQRDVLVNVLGPSNPISANGFVGTISATSGVFNLGTASNGPGTEVSLQYDGIDADTTALNNAMTLNANLIAAGNNGFRLNFNFVQVGTGTTMDMHILATGPGGATANFSMLIDESVDPFNLFIPYASFSTAGGFSFANVTGLQVNFNESGVQDVDFELDQIVAAQQKNTGYNFGNFPILSSIAGNVYVDGNNNGNIDPGEPPIGGVIVTLTGTNNLGQPVNLTTTTAPDGTYSFTNLRAGTYKLTESQPINFIDGKDTIGTPGGTTTNDMFSNIVLPGGFNGVQNNFGELGLTPTYASKRSLVSPAPPVVLTAIYATANPAPANPAAATATALAAPATARAATVAPKPATAAAPKKTTVATPVAKPAASTTAAPKKTVAATPAPSTRMLISPARPVARPLARR